MKKRLDNHAPATMYVGRAARTAAPEEAKRPYGVKREEQGAPRERG
jgi:hypothetical protein